MKRLVAVSIAFLALVAFINAQERRFTIDDLLKVRRVSDPQVSAKGNLVAFTITDMDRAANKGTTQIYLVPLNGGEGYLFGWLTIAPSDTSDLSGQLAWGNTGRCRDDPELALRARCRDFLRMVGKARRL